MVDSAMRKNSCNDCQAWKVFSEVEPQACNLTNLVEDEHSKYG